ncbi:hypothetical protein C0J52_08515 [Blattella germanica]|nr:hypothetical protein C0J52_08515 [Blattella germanica]
MMIRFASSISITINTTTRTSVTTTRTIKTKIEACVVNILSIPFRREYLKTRDALKVFCKALGTLSVMSFSLIGQVSAAKLTDSSPFVANVKSLLTVSDRSPVIDDTASLTSLRSVTTASTSEVDISGDVAVSVTDSIVSSVFFNISETDEVSEAAAGAAGSV